MSAGEEHQYDEAWPPGTVKIEDLLAPGYGKNGEIILQPQPTRDPNDPLNWQTWEKYLNFGLTCYYTIMVYVLVDVATVIWEPINEELGISYDDLNNAYAVGSAGLTIGAVFLVPFALKYGRRGIYVITTAILFAVSVWSAKMQTNGDSFGTMAVGCFVGALDEVIVQMTVADLFFVHQRGTMNSIFIWAAQVGGSLGPVAAGYIATSQGWRWVWWWNAILFGAGLIAFYFMYEETKFDKLVHTSPEAVTGDETAQSEADSDSKGGRAPQIALDAHAGLEAGTFNSESRRHLHAVEIDTSIPRKTYLERLSLFSTTSSGPVSKFTRHMWQPFLMLFTIPAIFYMALVYGVLMACVTVMVTALGSWMVEPPYNFDSSQVGLMSLPAWIGTTIGTLICGPFSDWLVLVLARRNSGVYEPEMRLWAMAAFIPFVPAGMFLFGIGLNNGLPWIQVAAGYFLYSLGTAPASTIALTYLTDAYTDIIGDAMVANVFVRNLISTILVFVMTPWIDNMGITNVYIILGVITTVIFLGVFGFIYYGKRLRYRSIKTYRYFAARQFKQRV